MSFSFSGNPVASYLRVTRQGAEEKALERISKQPDIKRMMDGFARAVDRAPDARTALRDPRVLAVIATALGIPDAAQQPGLATRALLSDPRDPNSLVNKLGDRRWRAAAQTLNLARDDIFALRALSTQRQLAEGVQRARWQEELNREANGLGDAVVFREQASSVKGPFDVLGNTILRRVVTTVLGLPKELAIQSVEAQARAITSKLDLKKLQDPKEVEKMAQRYIMLKANENDPFSGIRSQFNPMTALFRTNARYI